MSLHAPSILSPLRATEKIQTPIIQNSPTLGLGFTNAANADIDRHNFVEEMLKSEVISVAVKAAIATIQKKRKEVE